MTLIEIGVRFVIAVAVSFGDSLLACGMAGLMSVAGRSTGFQFTSAIRRNAMDAGYKACTVGATFLVVGKMPPAGYLQGTLVRASWVLLTLCVVASVAAGPLLTPAARGKRDESRTARQAAREQFLASCTEDEKRKRCLSWRSACLREGMLVARLYVLRATSWASGVIALSLGLHAVWPAGLLG